MKVENPIPEYEIIAPKESLIAWKHNAVTQQIIKIIKQDILNSSTRMGQGETLGENIIQETARAVGYVEGLNFLIDLFQLQFVVEGIDDDSESESKHDKEGA